MKKHNKDTVSRINRLQKAVSLGAPKIILDTDKKLIRDQIKKLTVEDLLEITGYFESNPKIVKRDPIMYQERVFGHIVDNRDKIKWGTLSKQSETMQTVNGSMVMDGCYLQVKLIIAGTDYYSHINLKISEETSLSMTLDTHKTYKIVEGTVAHAFVATDGSVLTH